MMLSITVCRQSTTRHPGVRALGKAAVTVCAAWAFLSAPARADKIDDFIKAEMERRHIPGLSLAVVRRGKVVKESAYGVANLELHAPATSGTLFQIGSITKQFTAGLIMMLADKGKLGLEDKISGYFDGAPASWKDITIRHLLNHTSGFKDLEEVPNFTFRNDYAATELLRLLKGIPLSFLPGERFSYSSFGYALLGMIAEKAGGEPFEAQLAKQIFEPVGMTATRLNHPGQIIAGRASGYRRSQGKTRNGDPSRPEIMAGSGGVLSTASDIAKWEAALARGVPVKQALVRQMRTPTRLNDGTKVEAFVSMAMSVGYGFAMDLGQYRGHRLIGHEGDTDAGFSSDLSDFTDDQMTVVLLCNLMESKPREISAGIAGLYAAALTPPDRLKEQPDPKLARTARLREALLAISAGDNKSPAIVPGLLDDIKPEQRKEISAALNGKNPLRFLACDRVTEFQVHMHGSTVTDLCYYRSGTPDDAATWVFYLTGAEKLAYVQSARGTRE